MPQSHSESSYIVPLIAALLLILKLMGAAAHCGWFLAGWEAWTKEAIAPGSMRLFDAQLLVGLLLFPGALLALGWVVFSIVSVVRVFETEGGVI